MAYIVSRVPICKWPFAQHWVATTLTRDPAQRGTLLQVRTCSSFALRKSVPRRDLCQPLLKLTPQLRITQKHRNTTLAPSPTTLTHRAHAHTPSTHVHSPCPITAIPSRLAQHSIPLFRLPISTQPLRHSTCARLLFLRVDPLYHFAL